MSRGKKLVPVGIRFIAYWHFFWSSINVFAALLVAASYFVGWKYFGFDIHKDLQTMEPFKSGAWRSREAINLYEGVCGWLFVAIGGPFIAFRLLAKQTLAYWLCLLEICVSIGLSLYSWHMFNVKLPSLKKGIDASTMSAIYSAVFDYTAISIVLAMLVFGYLMLPRIRKLYA